jgi:multidrug resistance efflux pump
MSDDNMEDHGQEQAEDANQLEIEEQNTYHATKILLLVIALVFTWYLVSDRLTPYTASARLQAFVIPVVPDVSGYIQEIPVAKYSLAEVGDTLLQLQTHRFDLAVRSAEAALEVAGQEVGARTAVVAAAVAQLSEVQVALTEARTQAQRVFTLERKGVFSRAQGDEARSIVATAEARLKVAEADLEQQRKALGVEGELNPRIRYALVQLNEARLNLANTTVKAHARGFVGSLYVDEGAYATAGSAVMTYITLDDIWIEALMTENNLGRIRPGNKVEIAFDAFPGKIFDGKVKKIAPGVSTGKKTDLGELSTAKTTGGWLRSSQRFSVIIETTDYHYGMENSSGVRHNSQVDVIVYTGDGFFWNFLGQFWIRLMSLLSYAY